ncbi:MAG: 23S rRNA (adenine(2503)-C(2))-methyltransferase RlmN, partial [Clostridiales bacterium]
KLAAVADASLPKVLQRQNSKQQDTFKLLLQLDDGEKIEMALMLYNAKERRKRATCCVSTQSGCRMGCAFCATGRFSQGRDLQAGEIVAQVQLAGQIAKEQGFDGITNVVYMGMGEPLLNMAQVKKSISLLNHSQGQKIGMRRFTISTCGLVPQIHEMADWGWQIGLALSLHAPNDALRQKLMPIAKKYTIRQTMEACRHYFAASGQRMTYEYAMFDGINDGIKEAEQLAELLRGEDCLINIIPANPVPETGFFPSGDEAIKQFTDILTSYGLEFFVRRERGRDIDAACGQLRHR